MTAKKANLIKMALSVLIIIFCVLGLTKVLPSAICVPVAMVMLGGLCLFSAYWNRKEKKGGIVLFMVLGVLLILFAAVAPFLQ